MWRWLSGVAVGALAAFWLDPQYGRGRRHAARDRVRGKAHRLQRRAWRSARHAQGPVRGAVHKGWRLPRSRGRGEIDDVTLARMAESALARDPRTSKARLNLHAECGVLVLHGEVATAEAIDDILEVCRTVDGVREVRSVLHLPGQPVPSGWTHDPQAVKDRAREHQKARFAKEADARAAGGATGTRSGADRAGSPPAGSTTDAR
jgi:hypothetical protein